MDYEFESHLEHQKWRSLMARIKKKHLMNNDTGKAWCTKKLSAIDNFYYYAYVESKHKLYCGPCMRRMLDSLQRSLDAIPTRTKKVIN